MKLFIFLLLAALLQADNLDSIVAYGIGHNTSLKSLQERLLAVENEKAVSRNFSNPDLSFTVNDIQFGDPTNFSLEPMQFTAVNIKQKIPYFGKRDAAEAKVESKRNFLDMSLEDLKVQLVKEIKITAFSIWETQKEAEILDATIEISNQNISLDEAYTSTSNDTQLALMSAKLSLSELKIERSSLRSLKNSLYKRLSYLAGEKIDQIDLSLTIDKLSYLAAYEEILNDSSALHVKSAELGIEKANLHIQELSSDIDPYIQAGYYHRENHPDYASFTIGASLPLYGSEKQLQEEARKLVLAKSYEQSDLKEKLNSQIAELYEKMQNDYKVYTIIKDESLPQMEHLLDILNSSLKTGDTLLSYTQMLQKKLNLDTKLIQTIADFHKTKAQLDALTGEKL